MARSRFDKIFYVAYSLDENDKYQLPIAIALSQEEMAKILNKNSNNIATKIKNLRQGKNITGYIVYPYRLRDDGEIENAF